MNKTEITENLFEAIDVIMEQRIQKLRYSQCYLMQIVAPVKNKELKLGVYQVNYQGDNYTATSLGYPYEIGDMVWVLAPQNSLEDELTIIGIVDYYYKEKMHHVVSKGKLSSGSYEDVGNGYWKLNLASVGNAYFLSSTEPTWAEAKPEVFYFEIDGVYYIDRPVMNID